MRKRLKNTALISSFTFLSRILGLVRDMIIAALFGTSIYTDAFFIAFRPFDLVRKLFSEGMLSASFIPVFSKTMKQEGMPGAAAMVASFFGILSFFAVIVVLAGLLFAPLIIQWIAPGFPKGSDLYHLTIVLFQLMLPYFWFALIAALSMGVLNAMGRFAAPGVAPVLFNLVMIGVMLVVSRFFQVPVMAAALGVTVGGFVQLAVQCRFLIHSGIVKPAAFTIYHARTLSVLQRLIPCMIGAASYQINIMVVSFFASNLTEGSISFLYYADRLVHFPLALFAVSVATVFLPDLSEKAAEKDFSAIGRIFSNGAVMVFFITMPAMAGLMALDVHIVNLLFGQGAFDDIAVQQTAQCLFFLVAGLWAFAGVRLFVTLYHALSSIWIPFWSGIAGIGVNLILCSFLIGPAGLNGMVMSVCLSSVINFMILLICLPAAVCIEKKRLFVSACRSLFFSAILFAFIKGGMVVFSADADLDGKLISGAIVGVSIVLGILLYFGLNMLCTTPEIKLLKKGLLERDA